MPNPRRAMTNVANRGPAADTRKSTSSKASRIATKRVVFVLGPPGCGKDTQAHRIAQVFGFNLVSVGEILRNEMKSMESPFREAIEASVSVGKIVSADITCKLLERHMQSARKTNFLVVGFPRNEENREKWVKEAGAKIETAFVLCIECPEEVCLDRCLKRGRPDDTGEILEKRFNAFLTETQATISHFDANNIVHTINGNQPEYRVFDQIRAVFQSHDFLPIDK